MRHGKTGVVELPKYVRRVIKPNGRIFYYYHRHRGTAKAWPMIQLPPAMDKGFAGRVELCGLMERHGDALSLGAKPLPSPNSPEFWPAAEQAMRAEKAATHAEFRTFSALIATFKAHDAYKRLSVSTRRGYDHSADLIEKAWGDDLVSELTTVDAQQAIDELGDTPAAANQFRAFLSRLVAFGVPRGFSTSNPVAFAEKMGGGEPWPPWPEWAFDTFFQHAPPHLALPAVSALFTGQRQGDVLAMPRPKASDSTIPVRAQKTGEIVWIPIHSEYRNWIENAPKADCVQLHIGVGSPGRAAGPYTTGGFRAEWRKLMKMTYEGVEVFARFREERIVFHGLRKNAVNALLEAGCTNKQVGAIVNMSEQMVEHYSRDVRVKALARDGMRLLENRWSELRPTGLPRTGTERELETVRQNWKPDG